jgi:hypothetical protein
MFVVLIKAMGFWCWVRAVEASGAALPMVVSQARLNPTVNLGSPILASFIVAFAAAALWKAALGCGLFFGANRITLLVYHVKLSTEAASH